MRNQHVWRETTEAGEKREVRATRFAGKWRLQSKLDRSAAWTYHEPLPDLPDLLFLRDLIWRKYQRKRASYDDVTSVDALIALRQPAAVPTGPAAGSTPERTED